MSTVHADPSAVLLIKPRHPIAFAILYLPFGALGGYVGVTLAYLCTRPEHGLSVQDGTVLVASGMVPHVWKFLWGPIADITLTRKRWYVISCVLCALGVMALAAFPLKPASLHLLQAINFIANLACTFLGMSVEGLMAHSTPPDQRGKAGGWFQAGNLGGYGLGGGAGLWMATHLPSADHPQAWISGAAIGACFLACIAALWLVPEAPPETRGKGVATSVRHVALELWDTIKSRGGAFCAILCLLPINTGAAAGILVQAEVAAKWNAGEDTVAIVNGWLSGALSVVGCLLGGFICDRFGSRKVYAAVALAMALMTVTMAFAPQTKPSYVGFLMVYNLLIGMSYAAFTGFVLDAIGKTAAATKYNAFASLSNFPITYMGLVLGWTYKAYGEHGMLLSESAIEVCALLVLGGVAAAMLPGLQRRDSAPPSA